jgi:hypothetical protein
VARVASYWHLGAWVVGHGTVQGDLAGLQVGESAWAADCLAMHEGIWRGCRRVSPHRQTIAWQGM